MMGNVMYPGGNDNASGTAMVLEMARYFSKKENQPALSLMFVLFSGEEAGLMGSKYMAKHFPLDLQKIQLQINVDMVATGSDGITMVNAKQFPDIFQRFVDINAKKHYLKEVTARGESCNSDHCPLYQEGVPSVFIYTRGSEATAYHIPEDSYESLPLTKFEDLFRLIRDYIQSEE
jgi:Zn-dependent M28 family amino/carboxypeptidase